MRRVAILLVIPLLAAGTLRSEPPQDAQDDGYAETVTVTASLTPMTQEESGSSITVIDRAEIDARPLMFLGDLLRGIPGVSISRSGPAGSVTQLRLRGAEANQTLVLIDGIAVNDLFAGDELPLELLTSYDVERIEIVRGPQSGVWGADALAGTINVITRAAPGSDAELQGGSFGTLRGAGHYGAKLGQTTVAVTGSWLDTDGTNASRAGNEKDGARNGTGSVRLGWKAPSRDAGFDVVGRYTDARADFDSIDFVTTGLPVDDDQTTDTSLALLGARGHWAPEHGRWRHEARVDLATSDTESFAAGASTASTSMDKAGLALQSTVRFGAADASFRHGLTVALDHEAREFHQRGPVGPFGDPNQNQSLNDTGLTAEYRARLGERFALSASVRHDRNSAFDDVTTFRAAGSYGFAGGATRLRGSIGTGQKPPTFIERFGYYTSGFVGNPGLEPEASTGWDLGVDQRLGRRTRMEWTYFQARLKHEINGFVFDPGTGAFTAENEAGTSRRRGAELALRSTLPHHVQLDVAYTFTDATQPDAAGMQERELRRPRHTGNLRLGYTPQRVPLGLLVDLAYVGAQDDVFFPPFPQPQQRVRLDDYVLADLTLRYRVARHFELLGRVENALDATYEDVYGFATPGRAAYLGVRYLGAAPSPASAPPPSTARPAR